MSAISRAKMARLGAAGTIMLLAPLVWGQVGDAGALGRGEQVADPTTTRATVDEGKAIGSPLVYCPADTINNPPIGQPPMFPAEAWLFGVSEAAVDNTQYERFVAVDGPICDVHFWGFNIQGITRRGAPGCVEDPMTFEINFYEDVPARRGALTMPGPLVCSYTVTLSGVDTGLTYGLWPLYAYETQLAPCCDMSTGWVSIQGISDPSCWFYVVSSNDGDGLHWRNSVGSWMLEYWDVAVCLTPQACPPEDGVVCEPQGGDQPVHPPTYWYEVTEPGFCDFHVRVFDPDPCHYSNWVSPAYWLHDVHEVDGAWWASWWDPSGQCLYPVMDCFTFGFDNDSPSVWGDWTITIGNSPDPYDMVQDSSSNHTGEADGYGYRVHVPSGPDPGFKWVQMPDVNETGLDVFASNPFGPRRGVLPVVLADDFACTSTGPLTEVTVWGSWYGDVLPLDDPGAVSFLLSIHEDIPAPTTGGVAGVAIDYSMPGALHCPLMYFEPGSFTVEPCAVELGEGFFWPSDAGGYWEPGADSVCWKYTFPLDETCIQVGTPEQPVVYWLDVQAFPEDSYAQFGWKTSLSHWNDNAVWGDGMDPPTFWRELTYPLYHDFARGPIDLAFAIRSAEPQECAPTPDGDGCLPYACPELDETCQPTCVAYDLATGQSIVTECGCVATDECRVEAEASPSVPCVDPGVASGSELPAEDCAYASPDDVWRIVDGLPPGSTIELDGPITGITCSGLGVPGCTLAIPPGSCEEAGGIWGGHGHCYSASLDVTLTGTGDMAGFNRTMSIPLELNEVHTGPRDRAAPAQSAPAEYMQLYGELYADPDFELLRIVAGSDYGLPCPGHVALVELPTGDFAVDSFFDITYQIEFVGAPGSYLDGLAGVTTDQIRVEMGATIPGCVGGCLSPQTCEEEVVADRDGTLDVCCACTGAMPCGSDTDCVVANDNCCEWDRCGSVTAGFCDPVVAMMYADVAGTSVGSPPNGAVNLTDVLCALDAFGVGNMENCANADVAVVGPADCPSGNGIVNLTDILKVLDAFGAPTSPTATQMCACPLDP